MTRSGEVVLRGGGHYRQQLASHTYHPKALANISGGICLSHSLSLSLSLSLSFAEPGKKDVCRAGACGERVGNDATSLELHRRVLVRVVRSAARRSLPPF